MSAPVAALCPGLPNTPDRPTDEQAASCGPAESVPGREQGQRGEQTTAAPPRPRTEAALQHGHLNSPLTTLCLGRRRRTSSGKLGKALRPLPKTCSMRSAKRAPATARLQIPSSAEDSNFSSCCCGASAGSLANGTAPRSWLGWSGRMRSGLPPRTPPPRAQAATRNRFPTSRKW